MGYKILISHLKLHAEKLGVKAFPSSREIINNLINNPPSIEKAPEIFSFITQRQSGIVSVGLKFIIKIKIYFYFYYIYII